MPRILPTKSILRLQVLLPLWRTLKLKNKQSSSPPFFSLQEFATLYFISNRHGHAHHLVKQPCEEKICFLWVYKKYVCLFTSSSNEKWIICRRFSASHIFYCENVDKPFFEPKRIFQFLWNSLSSEIRRKKIKLVKINILWFFFLWIDNSLRSSTTIRYFLIFFFAKKMLQLFLLINDFFKGQNLISFEIFLYTFFHKKLSLTHCF